jgi:RNA polymerase sigma factor (sigma-70 family)
MARSTEVVGPPRAGREIDSGSAPDARSQRWQRLMAKACAGDDRSYQVLFQELDMWLRHYYARRLPYPAAEDARQDTLLAVHASRHNFAPSGCFSAWVMGIARYKWIDRIRDTTRHAAAPLDDQIPAEDHERAMMSAAALEYLLSRLKPAQESAIRLVKLQGLSISRASNETGQSKASIKINIHRGLKKLAILAS